MYMHQQFLDSTCNDHGLQGQASESFGLPVDAILGDIQDIGTSTTTSESLGLSVDSILDDVQGIGSTRSPASGYESTPVGIEIGPISGASGDEYIQGIGPTRSPTSGDETTAAGDSNSIGWSSTDVTSLDMGLLPEATAPSRRTLYSELAHPSNDY